MKRTRYSVVAILPGRRDEYFSHVARTARVQALAEGRTLATLAITVDIQARSKNHAEEQVRKQYPDHAIDSRATRQHRQEAVMAE